MKEGFFDCTVKVLIVKGLHRSPPIRIDGQDLCSFFVTENFVRAQSLRSGKIARLHEGSPLRIGEY
jgi:hypothetical protein